MDNKSLLRIGILGWIETIIGALGAVIFIFFLWGSISIWLNGGLALQSLVIAIPITILTLPFPFYLCEGIHLIKYNKSIKFVSAILTVISILWFILLLKIGFRLLFGAANHITKLSLILPIVLIIVMLILRVFIFNSLRSIDGKWSI